MFANNGVNVACTGDIRTLLDWKNYKTIEAPKARFSYLFMNCEALTSAPELPAETLASYCYSFMFQGCKNLKTAPELPAKTLAEYCYSYMFNGCKNLETAPELPATTLAEICYFGMFQGCTNLSSVTMLAPSDQIKNTSNCCYNWLYNAGTSATSRTLKVKDKDAYNALLAGGTYLPAIWKIGATDTKVVNESGNAIQ